MRAALIPGLAALWLLSAGAGAASASDPAAKASAAPQAGKPAAAASAAKPAAAAAVAKSAGAAHAAKATAHADDGEPAAPKPDAKDARTGNTGGVSAADVDLIAVRDRIHARVAELRKEQIARRAGGAATRTTGSHGSARTAGSRAAAPAATAAPAAPPARIELVWRPTVIWPAEITGSAPGTSAASPDVAPAASAAVAVEWGPEP